MHGHSIKPLLTQLDVELLDLGFGGGKDDDTMRGVNSEVAGKQTRLVGLATLVDELLYVLGGLGYCQLHTDRVMHDGAGQVLNLGRHGG